jgi:hypothetical protein
MVIRGSGRDTVEAVSLGLSGLRLQKVPKSGRHQVVRSKNRTAKWRSPRSSYLGSTRAAAARRHLGGREWLNAVSRLLQVPDELEDVGRKVGAAGLDQEGDRKAKWSIGCVSSNNRK